MRLSIIARTMVISVLAPTATLHAQEPTVEQQIARLTQDHQLLQMQVSLLQTQAQLLAAQRALGADATQAADVAQQTALVNALVALQAAQSSLATSGVDAEAALATSRKALVDAQTALEKARLESRFAKATVLDKYFDAVGKEGTVSIKDSGTRLLNTSLGSAEAAYFLAGKLCSRLVVADESTGKGKGLPDADERRYFVGEGAKPQEQVASNAEFLSPVAVVDPLRLAAMQEAKVVTENLKQAADQLERANKKLAEALVPPTTPDDFALASGTFIGALAELPLVAGGIANVLKLFRADRDLLTTTETTRPDLFATFLSVHPHCQKPVHSSVPDYLLLNVEQPLKLLSERFGRLARAIDEAAATKRQAEALLPKEERAQQAVKPPAQKPEGEEAAENDPKPRPKPKPKPTPDANPAAAQPGVDNGPKPAAQADLTKVRPALAALTAHFNAASTLLNSIKSSEGENRLVTLAGLLSMECAIRAKPRLIASFVSQDVQEKKTSVWSSDKIIRYSSAQVSYRVLSHDNASILAGGFLSYSTEGAKDAYDNSQEFFRTGVAPQRTQLADCPQKTDLPQGGATQ